MKETIFSSEYSGVAYERDKNLMTIFFTDETIAYSKEAYKEDMIAISKLIESYKPEYMFTDLTRFRFELDDELQEWHAKHVGKIVSNVGIKKNAILNTIDYASQASVVQTMNRITGKKATTRYFYIYKDAIDWLEEK